MKKSSRPPKILSSEYSAFRVQIQELFKRKLSKEQKVILDPMAGTAPLIPFIEKNGHTAYLNDILPLHFFVNKAKTYQVFQQYQQHGYDWYYQQLLSCMAPLEGKELCISHKWIDDSILRGLIQAWHTTEHYDENSETLLKAAILLCVRPLSSTTKSKNPTWLKYGGMSSGKDLLEIVRDSLIRFDEYYRHHYKSSNIKKKGECIISRQNATELHLPQKVDFILTSPPYCNRIDPVVQYGPENFFLSALGHTIPEECLVSITKVKDYDRLERDLDHLKTKSKYACKLLTRIEESKKPDDPGYYLKYYTRYFAKLFQVMDKVLSNLSATGEAYIVTQDNSHRGQRIQIDKVLRELLRANGWRSKVIRRWPRHHQGLRHVYRSAFISPMQLEKLVVIRR